MTNSQIICFIAIIFIAIIYKVVTHLQSTPNNHDDEHDAYHDNNIQGIIGAEASVHVEMKKRLDKLSGKDNNKVIDLHPEMTAIEHIKNVNTEEIESKGIRTLTAHIQSIVDDPNYA